MKGVLGRMLYANYLAVVAESRWEMQEVLEEWKKAFEKHALFWSVHCQHLGNLPC